MNFFLLFSYFFKGNLCVSVLSIPYAVKTVYDLKTEGKVWLKQKVKVFSCSTCLYKTRLDN